MVQKNPHLEIACFNLDSARIAQENEVDRIELCDGFEVGGTTPNTETTRLARATFKKVLFVMIRPRGGNFVYSDAEFNEMKSAIQEFKKLKVDGFVFGILNQNKSINTLQNSELVQLAAPFPCTFHRAFDEVADAFQSLEAIIECGFQTVLTSGQSKNVVDGMERLSELVSKANNRITIMPGGGLRSSNIKLIQQKTNANWYHSSAITEGNQIANANEINALKSNLNHP